MKILMALSLTLSAITSIALADECKNHNIITDFKTRLLQLDGFPKANNMEQYFKCYYDQLLSPTAVAEAVIPMDQDLQRNGSVFIVHASYKQNPNVPGEYKPLGDLEVKKLTYDCSDQPVGLNLSEKQPRKAISSNSGKCGGDGDEAAVMEDMLKMIKDIGDQCDPDRAFFYSWDWDGRHPQLTAVCPNPKLPGNSFDAWLLQYQCNREKSAYEFIEGNGISAIKVCQEP